jgi:hypothetical protein
MLTLFKKRINPELVMDMFVSGDEYRWYESRLVEQLLAKV